MEDLTKVLLIYHEVLNAVNAADTLLSQLNYAALP